MSKFDALLQKVQENIGAPSNPAAVNPATSANTAPTTAPAKPAQPVNTAAAPANNVADPNAQPKQTYVANDPKVINAAKSLGVQPDALVKALTTTATVHQLS